MRSCGLGLSRKIVDINNLHNIPTSPMFRPLCSLPFAVLSGGAKGSFVVSWRNSGGNSPLLLIESATQFSFSPDGKWVTLKKNNYDKDTVTTCLMPVSEKYPHYLGSPIMQFEKDFDNDNFAWTSNPVSFVGSYMKKIYRWDLDNQPHPGSDKMSFHDYIVERDLEKLTREKRQGLGK